MGRKTKIGDGTTDVARGESDTRTWDILRSLVSGESDASKLLEMYYWTREPGIVEVLRAYLDLPDATQRHLANFLLKNRPQTIVSAVDPQGRLQLSSGEIQRSRQSQRSPSA